AVVTFAGSDRYPESVRKGEPLPDGFRGRLPLRFYVRVARWRGPTVRSWRSHSMKSVVYTGLLAMVLTAAGCTARTADSNADPASSSQAATAEPSLRIPLLEEVTSTKTVKGRKKQIHVKKLLDGRNAVAKANGIAPFPRFVEVTKATGAKPF